ncbi:cation diffusion facilitator family transporter [Lachnobacterium bovis]|uniref:Cation diffusion facilitator family transporter n=1 Tax=Lachnobacterium bovis TaxID=140626 RepID=A0A1H9PWU7_9FIRM|nr:cation diffusion facilitator family transporter [Lachnobacterium bovis]SER52701.1 cation diffusion facilitator family transporter [Lachnobacterium bovis]
MMNREKSIIKTSIIGIVTNCLLALFKAIVGALTNSIAIVLDAINNLSDAMSSIVTIVGTKLANKEADKKHPLGYGRVEYLSATIIACIVLYAGFTSFVESIKKIISPQKPNYTIVSIIIICVAVFVKIILGTYVKNKGEKLNSDSLVASGTDALFDAIISASTVLAALIFVWFKISLEAYIGAVISVIIIKSGVEILRDTISKILGERVDGSFTKKIKKTVNSIEDVKGAYDLILHNYGPDKFVGSIHIEVNDTLSANDIDRISRKVYEKVLLEHGVFLEGVGIYSINTQDEEALILRKKIVKLVRSIEGTMQVHGFYVDKKESKISFDTVIEYGAKDKNEILQEIQNLLKKEMPEYTYFINIDRDVSD